MEYNSGNFDKYMSKNPLKRKMVMRLNDKIIRISRELVNEIESCNNKVRVLDAGCGEGFITNLLVSNIANIEAVGLEYTQEALEIAQKSNSSIQWMRGDIYQLPFEDNAFDIVICTEVLEHLSDPCMAISELKRVCKKYVLLTVPNEPWFCMGNLIAFKNILRLGNPIDHINHWTYRAFQKFLGKELGNCTYGRSFPWSMAIWKKDTNK